MTKKTVLRACLVVLALFCAGCGSSAMPDSAAGSPPSASASPADSSAATSQAADRSTHSSSGEAPPAITPYTLERSITVEDGRELTLRLHGQVDTTEGFEQIGISAIDVLDGSTLLQTLSIGDAFDQLYHEIGFEDWVGQYHTTQSWTEDGDLTDDDLNFDGYRDIRLMSGYGVVNLSYLCWLWDPDAEQFTYAFELVGYDVHIDADAQQIITETRDGWGQYYTHYYRYDGETGTLQQLKEIHEDYAAQGATVEQPVVTVHELIDGVWTQIS